jgi:hypothetical protein
VVVRPSIGAVDEPGVVEAVLGHLHSRQHLRLMAEVWREGDTLRVVRRDPGGRGPGSKILPLLARDYGGEELREPTPRSGRPAAT